MIFIFNISYSNESSTKLLDPRDRDDGHDVVAPGRHELGRHHPLATTWLELQDLVTGLAVISSFKGRFSVKYKYNE